MSTNTRYAKSARISPTVGKEKREILTPEEARRLEQLVQACGGQLLASQLLSVTPGTLSRTTNRHTAPDRALERDLVLYGVVRGERAERVLSQIAAARFVAERVKKWRVKQP